jgi:hypothetical protein
MYGKIVIISKKFFRVAEKLQVRYISKEGNMFAVQQQLINIITSF